MAHRDQHPVMPDRRDLRGRLTETARGVAGTLSSGTKRAVGAVKDRVTSDDEVDQLEARVERIEQEAREEAEREARQEYQEEYRESVQEAVREERKQELRQAYGEGMGQTEAGQPPSEEAAGEAPDNNRVGTGLLSVPAPAVPDPGAEAGARVNVGQVPSPTAETDEGTRAYVATGQAPSLISEEEQERRRQEAYVAVGGPPADNGDDRQDPHVPLTFEF